MCGIYYSNQPIARPEWFDSMRQRGPEGFREHRAGSDHWAHSLLNTLGPVRSQPWVTHHGVLVYNGSTYNYRDSEWQNDTEWLAHQLTSSVTHTHSVIRGLVGEYALCWTTDSHTVFAADQFYTRNLWYYYSESDRVIAVSSFPDLLIHSWGAAWPCEDNTIYTLDRHSHRLTRSTTTEWNFAQTQTSLDGVHSAFERAVEDRFTPGTVVLLSSGMDSGAIACCLEQRGIDFPAIASITDEHNQVFADRIQRHSAVVPVREWMTQAELEALYRVRRHPNLQATNPNTAKLQTFCRTADELGCKIFLCGEGADEIYADYGHGGQRYRVRSKFGGIWHERLDLLWPWHNNYNSLNNLNSRMDQIFGYNGKETRLPFQDQRVVQAWLHTVPELKNRSYKHWIEQYLRDHDYPYHSQKIGLGGKTSETTDKFDGDESKRYQPQHIERSVPGA